MLELKEEAECLGTEMSSRMTGSHRGTAQLTSRKPGNRWQQQFVSDTTVVQVGCRLGAGWVQVGCRLGAGWVQVGCRLQVLGIII